MMKRALAVLLAALMTALAPGFGPYELLAQQVVAAPAAQGVQVPVVPVLPVGVGAVQGALTGNSSLNASAVLPALSPLPVVSAAPSVRTSAAASEASLPAVRVPAAAASVPGAVVPVAAAVVPARAVAVVPGKVLPAEFKDAVGNSAATAAAAQEPVRRSLLSSLRLPSLLGFLRSGAGVEESRRLAETEFVRRAGGADAADAGALAGAVEGSAASVPSAVSLRPGLSGKEAPAASTPAPQTHPVLRAADPEAKARYRWAFFPIVMAALTAALCAASVGVPLFSGWAAVHVLSTASLQSFWAALVGELVVDASAVIATLSGLATAALAAWGVYDLATFAWTVTRGGQVSDEQFWIFAKEHLQSMGLHPSVISGLLGYAPGRGILKVYRPAGGRFSGFAFGLTQGGSIYMRPELACFPWLFRAALKHELSHFLGRGSRAPPAPRSGLGGFFHYMVDEAHARISELASSRTLREMRMPVLDRVLREAQISLRLRSPYDVLLLSPSSDELLDPSLYRELSDGKARVHGLWEVEGEKGAELRWMDGLAVPTEKNAVPAGPSALRRLLNDRLKQSGRYRVVVLPGMHATLPQAGTYDQIKLEQAIKLLDEIYTLSLKNKTGEEEGFRPGGPEARRLQALADNAGVRVDRNRMQSSDGVEEVLSQLKYEYAQTRIEGLPLVDTLKAAYDALEDRGVVLMPFAEGDPGVTTVERILRAWVGRQEGSFQVRRVDLAEGGHVLVARKLEPRVNLWLTLPQGASRIRVSETNLDTDPEAMSQDDVMRLLGFSDKDMKVFQRAGLRVRHVFGDDVGQQRIYVSVLKPFSKFLKRYTSSDGARLTASQGGYRLHLIESGTLQNVNPVWKLRIRGEGGRIYDIDTGLDTTHPDFADRLLKCIDFVNEGPEDWIGHGTHKAGISYANGTIYKGMAPAAEGRMGKVFSQSGFGASDGDIMAAAVDAMKWGADVISLSLGSPGSSDSPLAEFFSKLMEKKNEAGESPIGTGSAGNSGPFNRTLSQPSVGANMIAVAAAAKSLDDGVPEIAFYSSVGPAADNRYGGLRRLRMKPELTALGGDVTTPPGATDVYAHGIESVKSKDMPAGPSDAKDGRHTRMSGTSMSNPQVAGIALLVKQAVKAGLDKASAAYAWFMEHLPFSIKMVLMRSSVDMRVPVFFQGAGFVDAMGAVKLAVETFGAALGLAPLRMLRTMAAAAGLAAAPAQAQEASWAWLERVAGVQALEDKAYQEAETARQNVIEKARQQVAAAENPEDPAPPEKDEGETNSPEAQAALQKRFNEVRAEVAPALRSALTDPVWLVRFYAAFALLNLKSPEAALDLVDAALNDDDGRVRQMAFLALAETPSYAADELLRKAVSDARADVGVYAAYALARHGDASHLDRIHLEMQNADKKVRFTAAWVAGQIGSRATTLTSDALANRIGKEDERGNIRHLAAASLTEIVNINSAAVSDNAVVAMLDASGPQNFALTRTISKFFKTATRLNVFKARLKADPLHGPVAAFIQKHKAAAAKPGALGEMVQLLARILNVPLDLPTPAPDKGGAGVAGVDPNLGPIHLLVEMPKTAALKGAAAPRIERYRDYRSEPLKAENASTADFGLEPQLLGRFEARLQVAMPVSQTVWVNIPESRVVAFIAELESKGFRVRRAKPVYGLVHETGPMSGMPEIRKQGGPTGKGVLVAYLDEGGDTAHPALGADRIKFKSNFSGEGGVAEVETESIGHGTHGMGIVGARSVDGSPYVGMAPDVDFAVGKVLGANGGTDAMVMAGMEWAASLVEDPLKTPVLVNMSLGGPGTPEDPLSLLVNKLRLRNITVVAAAGNEGPGEDTIGAPAAAALAIRVGAADKKKNLTFYSSRGVPGKLDISWVDFGGGVSFGLPNPYEIVSTLATRLAQSLADAPTTEQWKGQPLYQYMSGTSMAAPHSTGKLAALIERMAAVMKEKFGSLPDGYSFFLEGIVRDTADPMFGKSYEVGAGLYNETKALAALDEALKDPAKVKAESEALMARARAQYGDQPSKPAEGKKVNPFKAAALVVRDWILPSMAFFAFPLR
ncbi:MAG: S8 family serine peptidase [Elusimicrobiota bacterium]|jgi:subtilisin family serine protease